MTSTSTSSSAGPSSTTRKASLPLLSPEDLATQLSVLEVLLSIYSSSSSPGEAQAHPETDDGTSELYLSPSSYVAIERVANYLRLPVATLGDEKSTQLKEALPPLVMIRLRIEPLRGMEGADEPSAAQAKGKRKLELDVGIPLRKHDAEASANANRRPRMSLRCPDWMSRATHAELCKEVGLTAPMGEGAAKADPSAAHDEEDEDGASIVMDTIERISEASLPVLEALDSQAAAEAELASLSLSNGAATAGSASSGSLSDNVYRSWSVLTSLSTPAKRKDLVDYAASTFHSYLEPSSSPGAAPEKRSQPLTGFVLAGKPAFVVIECPLPTLPSFDLKSSSLSIEEASTLRKALEDARATLDSYWSEIKSRSWADIPSHQKKVTERLREEGVKRAWSDVREMTESEELGGKEAMRGQYGHRNDLRRVEKWLVEEKRVSKEVWNEVVGIGATSE